MAPKISSQAKVIYALTIVIQGYIAAYFIRQVGDKLETNPAYANRFNDFHESIGISFGFGPLIDSCLIWGILLIGFNVVGISIIKKSANEKHMLIVALINGGIAYLEYTYANFLLHY